MKNLKIGTKIALGFGVVIVMMLGMALVVLIANIRTLGNVGMIEKCAGLQTLSAQLETSFLNTEVAANLLSGTMDPAVYAEFSELADITAKDFEAVYGFIDENPELAIFRLSYEKAQETFNKWRADADIIGKANEEQAAFDEQLAANGVTLVESTNTILNSQLTIAIAEIQNVTDNEALLQCIARISSAARISRDIAGARVMARQITGTFNPAPLSGALELLDKARSGAAVYRDESPQGVQRESAQAAVNSIAGYRDALDGFGQACVRSAAVKEEMPALKAATQLTLAEAYDNIDESLAQRIERTQSSATRSLAIVIAVSVAGLLSAVIIALLNIRVITRPVRKMHNVINIVGNSGRMNFSEDEIAEIESEITKDEIGQSIESFVKMINRLGAVAATLEKVAAGDLTVTLSPLTNEDTMGIAVSSMVDNLNKMFEEINCSTAQVSMGASQVADGAQTLAQGATEQAATVQQLSSSVAHVSNQTKTNAAVAEETRALEDNIKHRAEQGAEQMKQMMQAVKDISEASQAIGKVIKIIDDIAFQTNILALNAAVEAARAGQHGKGFAVVADEVRNLAAKSAEAAKDTGELIETSIKKSEMGAKISADTARSLNLIVEGVLKSSKLVADIAQSSGEQSVEISQISEAIGQVSQVVQQNSATSEQSAAASQEMSGQAAVLRQLIARFNLRSSGETMSHV